MFDFTFHNPTKIIFGLDSAEAGIGALEQWFVVIKSPVRLHEVKIPATDIAAIAAIAANAEGLARQWGIGGVYTQETIAEILRLAA